MIYSDRDIERALGAGDISIDGLVDDAIQPASVDFHLSDRPFKVWAHSGMASLEEGMGGTYDSRVYANPIVPWEDQSEEMSEMPFREHPRFGEAVTLRPGQFALASTTERVEIGGMVAGRLEGKSSLARLGLIVHTTAGFFDPGFEGYPTLELLNVSPRPMLLRPGMPIAQMAFFKMTSEPRHLYSERGKYDGQGADPEPSHYFENFKGDDHG